MFGSFKEVFHVYVTFLLVLSTKSDIVKVRKGCLEIILLYKLHHLSLETSYAIGDARGQTRELIEVVPNFKGCVGLLFIFKWHLMIHTSVVDSAEDSVLGDLIEHVGYSWQREYVNKRKTIDGL